MSRDWTTCEVLEFQKRATTDARYARMYERLRPELEAARSRGDWSPVATMNRKAFARYVIEDPHSRVSAPAALVWSRPEVQLLERVDPARGGCRVLRTELLLAEREGRVHPGIRGESGSDVQRELVWKIQIAAGIKKAHTAIAAGVQNARECWSLNAAGKLAGGRQAESVLMEALKHSRPFWPYDRLAGWRELYSEMCALYSARGVSPPGQSAFWRALARVDAEYAQLQYEVAYARNEQAERLLNLNRLLVASPEDTQC